MKNHLKFTKENKKLLILTVAVCVLSLSLFFSYAYLKIVDIKKAEAVISGTGERIEGILFPDGQPLMLEINDGNFTGSDTVNLQSNTVRSTVEIFSKTDDKPFSDSYYVMLNIKSNDFKYVKSNHPEMILTIKKNGEEIKDDAITTLPYVTAVGKGNSMVSAEVSGFDITEAMGNLTLLEIPISSTEIRAEDNWEFTITYMAYDFDQSKNSDKKFDAVISFSQLKIKDIILLNNGGDEYIDSDKYLPDILSEEDETDEEYTFKEGLYSLGYEGSISYVFSGLSKNNWVRWNGEDWRILKIDEKGDIRLIKNEGIKETADDGSLYEKKSCFFDNTPDDPNTCFSDGDFVRPEYAGYMYTEGEFHGNTNSSTVKQLVDKYYEDYIKDSGIKDDIADSLYCDNRNFFVQDSEGSTIFTKVVKYPSFKENLNDGDESEYVNSFEVMGIQHFIDSYQYGNDMTLFLNNIYNCENEEDTFSTNNNDDGNKALRYPIFIPSDKDFVLLLATAENNIINLFGNEEFSYEPDWLAANYFWTVESTGGYKYAYNPENSLSQSYFIKSVFLLDASDYNEEDILYQKNKMRKIRPVISLKGDLKLASGDGTEGNPYTVVSNSAK